MPAEPLDVLALAAHPDDVELCAGGTMCVLAQQGYRTGIVDFTRGELGSRGTPELRLEEAARGRARSWG
ncbi:MAG: PIG-L family deacetylase [Bacteroidota bacterium]